jgi:hypothetical protein
MALKEKRIELTKKVKEQLKILLYSVPRGEEYVQKKDKLTTICLSCGATGDRIGITHCEWCVWKAYWEANKLLGKILNQK